ncbi:hypothetical protein AMS68_006484 [Peltaster fructicola]|uniref:Glycosyltransferase family 8 protein n=1 Tax=Peltaster fructicola TaxID=286661 RepID=A0A6H0Y1V1_9PEZI|nr:hypothetical protein AMS68_006484 [Peltaster fructicola]
MPRPARILVAFAGLAFILFVFLVPGSPFSLRYPRNDHFQHTNDIDRTRFNADKWFFEAELPIERYPPPKYDVDRLKAYASHNYKGPGHPTFATYFASRDGTLQDPYFLATQQMTYRLLWDPRSRSIYPFTVFVAPFIPQQQRDILAAAGATVREMPLVPFKPKASGGLIAGRLRDMFSKLYMWNMVEFSKIVYLDSDAFPLINVDDIFDQAPEQKCRKELLPLEDKSDTICDYIFSAAMEHEDSINAGVMVLKPDVDMYNRLIRESHNTSNFESGMMEQAFLSYAFSKNGPFPTGVLAPPWNAMEDFPERGIDVYILHSKLWALWWETSWCSNFFNETWRDMLSLYQSPHFEQLRAQG